MFIHSTTSWWQDFSSMNKMVMGKLLNLLHCKLCLVTSSELWAWWLWDVLALTRASPWLLMVSCVLLQVTLVLKKSVLWWPFSKLLASLMPTGPLCDNLYQIWTILRPPHMLWVYSLHTHAINFFKASWASYYYYMHVRLLLSFKGLDLETCCNP